MINRRLQIAVIAGILILVNACNKKTEEVPDKEQIKKEIQEKENEFAATYNAKVIKSIGYYSNDAISFYQNRAPLVGKDSIVIFLRANLENDHNTIEFTTKEVFPSTDANQVVEIGYFKVMDSTKVLINHGNYMSFFERVNGKYICLRDMSVSDISLTDADLELSDTVVSDKIVKSDKAFK